MSSTDEIMKIALEMSGFKEIPADTTVYVPGKNIKKILFGIDAGVPELLLAQQLNCDAVISHHPQGGSAIIDWHRVFERHIQQMTEAGVPLEEAEQAVRKKQTSLRVETHSRNYDHAVSVAKLMKMPYMNIHAPLDEIGRKRMSNRVTTTQKISPDLTVGDIVAALENIPEFKNAETKIEVGLGKASNKAGKVVVSHAAATNGGYEVAKTYFRHGVNTLIYIHVSPADLEMLKKDGVGNLIVTGHIASDSVGINPFISELEKKGITVVKIGVVPS